MSIATAPTKSVATVAGHSAPARLTPQQKFNLVRAELDAGLVERTAEIDLILTALAANEHVLLVGTYGLGKSMLADLMVEWIHGKSFSVQTNKYTMPEQIEGAVDINLLKEGKFRRITANKLPEADVAFIDEIFKGSSAILNTTLQILNERKYINGDLIQPCPLKVCIGASNEWPSGENSKDLGALFDRFMFRREIRPVTSDAGLDRLMWGDVTVTITQTITPAELDQAQADVAAMPFDADAKDSFEKIVKSCRSEGVLVGDRRIRKCVRACQAYSWIQGKTSVDCDDLSILGDCLWVDPIEQPRAVASIIKKHANPISIVINGLMIELEQIVKECNVKDPTSLVPASKKVAEIAKKLGKMGDKAEPAFKIAEAKYGELLSASMDSLR